MKDYETVYPDLRKALELNKILIPTGGTFQRGASAAITQAVTASKRLFQPSPIIYLKAQKNMAEIKGMKKAHLRDAVAMCTVLNYLEKKVPILFSLEVVLYISIIYSTLVCFISQIK